jgi:hypothetical protein
MVSLLDFMAQQGISFMPEDTLIFIRFIAQQGDIVTFNQFVDFLLDQP